MPSRVSHIAVHNEAGALRYNGYRRLDPNQISVRGSHLYCEPPSAFQCTDACAAKVVCKALVMEGRFANAFSPFMMDLAMRMRAFGWDVLDVEGLTRARCIPDILAFYILKPAAYNAAVRWRDQKLANDPEVGPQLIRATWLLLMEDVGDGEANFIMRKAGTWFDGILARYAASTISQLNHHLRLHPKRQVLSFPHAATRDFLLPLSFDAKDDAVLLSGEVGQDYPLRVAARALSRQGEFEGVIRRRTVTTRTSDFSNPRQQAKSYAKEIARFHIAIAGCRQFHTYLWLVAKHFEIMAAGTAMLTDIDAARYLRPLGLRPGWHYLESTPLQLNETLRHWLAPQQRDTLRLITERGQRVVKSFHMGETRAHSLNEIASAIWASKNNVTAQCPGCKSRVDPAPDSVDGDAPPGSACGGPYGRLPWDTSLDASATQASKNNVTSVDASSMEPSKNNVMSLDASSTNAPKSNVTAAQCPGCRSRIGRFYT